MAITDFIRGCNYNLGSLINYIYVIPKDSAKILYHAHDFSVNIDKIDAEIKKIECRNVSYNQQQTYQSRFVFENELELIFDEIWMDTFHDALKYIRHNNCYIIFETREGVQFLTNIELHTQFTYNYSFTDQEDEGIYATLTFTNTSNIPLLRVVNKISSNDILVGKLCDYSLCKVKSLIMSPKGGIFISDGNVTSNNQYKIDYLPDTFNYTEEYNGEYFRQMLSFSIPLGDYQDYWEYRLTEFYDNRYCAVIQTENKNLIILGLSSPLSPNYSIETSEDISTPNIITITLESYSVDSAYTSIIPTRWVKSDMFDCINVEYNCFRLVENGYFAVGGGVYREKWKLQISEDCSTWQSTGDFIIGEILTKNPHDTDTPPDDLVDDVVVDTNNGEWQLMTENIPLPTKEEGTAYESIGNYHVDNGRAKIRIVFKDISNFNLWYRSGGESSFDYLIVSKLDTELPSNATSTSSSVAYYTRSKQNTWYEAIYPNDGREHFIEVVYLKDGSTNIAPDKGFVFIPSSKKCKWKVRWIVTDEIYE